ncbi:MAG TPA: asparagine synthase (glutamine-hydrolyzing) [Candidatus Saccharimonadales bacterium]|nr:asparagine synthase (glutamine-hydrolyzing) [Candidatus Saccharimonadales bacterium]
MCGIAGKALTGSGEVTTAELEQMGQAIIHRGPDDSGTYVSPDKKVGLSFRRLAIIDLSMRGHQPMIYRNRYWIVFNGEIYNYQALKADLVKDGYAFRSQTDTEVIMALYDKYQEKVVEHLRGMFALAIYDEQEKTLFCARDRVGKKPFKYFYDGKVFLFASELKAILTQKEYHKAPDYEAIHHYLTYQYVPAPLTGFVGIKKLEPGHWLKLNLQTATIKIERYWRLDYSEKLELSEAEWKKRIMTKLDESVAIRMMSDVPLGAFLSGGIDSSAVVALMSRHSKNKVKTFSIGFKEARYNELPYARQVAEKFKTDHTEFIVSPDAVETLPLLVRHYEEPYADSSALPSYYVSKLTRQHVTVALNGDGGDENFAGYSRYSVQKFALAYDRFWLLHQLLAQPAATAFSRIVKNTFTERAERFARTMSKDYARRYVNYICYFTNEAKAKLYSPAFKAQMTGINSEDHLAAKFAESQTPDELDQTLYADFTTYLPDDLLAKVDIATMAVSLEGRSPFLDHELLELTAKMPFELKLKGRDQKKYILKEALRGLIPDEVMFRPKMGFGVPIEAWFRDDLRQYTRHVLLGPKLKKRNLFNQAALHDILDGHEKTKVNHANQIWALLTLELWFEEYFD